VLRAITLGLQLKKHALFFRAPELEAIFGRIFLTLFPRATFSILIEIYDFAHRPQTFYLRIVVANLLERPASATLTEFHHGATTQS
jgi:hypothetical protein